MSMTIVHSADHRRLTSSSPISHTDIAASTCAASSCTVSGSTPSSLAMSCSPIGTLTISWKSTGGSAAARSSSALSTICWTTGRMRAMKPGFRPCASRRRAAVCWGPSMLNKLGQSCTNGTNGGDDGCAAALQLKRLSDSTPFTSSKRVTSHAVCPEGNSIGATGQLFLSSDSIGDGSVGTGRSNGNVGIEVLVIALLSDRYRMPRFALPGTSTSRQPIALGRDPQTGTSPNLARIARHREPNVPIVVGTSSQIVN